MHTIVFTARRSLISGVTAGDSHEFAPLLVEKDRTRRAQRRRVVSLGGVPFTTYHRGDVVWQLQTVPLAGLAAAEMRMFLDSVEDGQTFSFDPFNAPGVDPDGLRSVVIDSDSYTERRQVRRGGGGDSDAFVFQFRLLEVP